MNKLSIYKDKKVLVAMSGPCPTCVKEYNGVICMCCGYIEITTKHINLTTPIKIRPFLFD